jgi:hypothetical protein
MILFLQISKCYVINEYVNVLQSKTILIVKVHFPKMMGKRAFMHNFVLYKVSNKKIH